LIKRAIITIFVSINLILFFTSCEDKQVYDVEVNVLSVTTEAIVLPNETKVTRHANVNYCIENTCEKTIHGWEIYFNVALYQGTNITAMDNIYYSLESGETSKTQIAMATIPSYCYDARYASLKNIEIW